MRRRAVWAVILLIVVSASGAASASVYRATGAEAGLPANAATGSAQDVELSSISCPSAGDCSAVGSYVDNTGATDLLLLTETGGAWGAGTEAVLPANAAASQDGVGLDSVSCASAGNCSAVGSYFDSSGATEGLLVNETAGTWGAAVEATLPANAAPTKQSASLNSVSCTAAGSCSAVGAYANDDSGADGLLLTETAGGWGAGVEAALPANTSTPDEAGLVAVSCASAGNCSAVGSYADVPGGEGLLVSETDGSWKTGVEAPLPANASTALPGVDLSAISCASAGDCSAVGVYNNDSSSSNGVLLTETAGSWATGVTATLPASAGAGGEVDLNAVSCASAGDCAAVGGYANRDGQIRALVLSEKGGRWSNGLKARLPRNASGAVPGDQSAELRSVSCASAGNCSAVGSYIVYSKKFAADSQQGLSLTQTANRWAAGVEAALPDNATYGAYLDAVSCAPAAKRCGAVGSYAVSKGLQGLLTRSSAPPPCLVPKPRREDDPRGQARHRGRLLHRRQGRAFALADGRKGARDLGEARAARAPGVRGESRPRRQRGPLGLSPRSA